MSNLASRVDRIASTRAIERLSTRHTMALYRRAVQSWLDMFVENGDCGRRSLLLTDRVTRP